MHILCPHCRNPIEVVKLNPREEIACPSCGSSFRLETESTTSWQRKDGHKLGKYELLDTVGQGAFGTVYKARDPELDRVVAVKVPRAGNLAGPQELDRFVREARSVAQLRHPSIVSVHDVGAVDGVPYLVSDFVEGLTLSDLLSSRRPGFREAAALVAAVADALQYAHDHGVVHRDVKPSNIMIGADGTAFVMDFGLAKREAGEITMTVEGQVLGTPAYMPPEQARGEGHAVDARGDVYSLGVVLYQLLTGELPFRGTQRMLLHQVLHDEPRAPRRLNDHIPRDLETIALKAMMKEPGRRYATARELAEDLRRWLKGETIRARPVGRVERAAKWVRRNPTLAAAAATVVGILVTATVVSTSFGIDARNKEAAAVAARNDLAKKNTELEQSQAEVIKQNTALEQKQDQLEGALARTWLSPLAETPGPLNYAEIAAFTELARHRNERLAQRFVAEALNDRQGMRRLRARAAFALHAAVGLDPGQRQEAEGRLVRALEAPDLPEESRTDLALAASELGELTPSAAAVVAQTLVRTLATTNDPSARRSLVEGLAAVSARLQAKEAGKAAATLTQALTTTKDPEARRDLAKGLSAVSVRLEAKEAGVAAAKLTRAMANANDGRALHALARGLAAVSARLEAGEAARVSAEALDALTHALTTRIDPWVAFLLPEILAAVSARLGAKEAGEAAAKLTQALTTTKDLEARGCLAQGLLAVSARLGAKEARAAADALTRALAATDDPDVRRSLARGLAAVSDRLGAKEAGEAADALTWALTTTKDPGVRRDLVRGLAAVSARLGAGEAARVSAEAADTLTRALTTTKDLDVLRDLAQGLAAVSARLGAKEARAAADALTRALAATDDPDVRRSLARGLAAVSDRLGAKEAGEAADALTRALAATDNPEAPVFVLDPLDLVSLAEGLAAVAARLEAGEAARVSAKAAATLTRAMAMTNKTEDLYHLARGLAAVSARLEAGEAARVAAEAAATLTRALTMANSPGARDYLARGLAVVSARLEAKEAAVAATKLTRAMSTTNDPEALPDLARGLSAVLGDAQRDKRAQAVAAAVGCLHDSGGLPGAVLLLRPAAEPFPRRLSDQDLVELLKHPLCAGAARRAVLDQLEIHHRRTFADHWEFVRYAEEQKLGLDFRSPPRLPESLAASH